jgi:SM-20-related protein
MRVRLEDFDAAGFSLHEHPVLVLENFWSPEEMTRYRGAMQRSDWITRGSMEDTAKSFPGCGDWGKAVIQEPERDSFLQRVMMPFVTDFVDSFEDVASGGMGLPHPGAASRGGWQWRRTFTMSGM